MGTNSGLLLGKTVALIKMNKSFEGEIEKNFVDSSTRNIGKLGNFERREVVGEEGLTINFDLGVGEAKTGESVVDLVHDWSLQLSTVSVKFDSIWSEPYNRAN